LRELADFETPQTPQFRHPSLKGDTELKQITLLEELDRLGEDIYDSSEEKLKSRKRPVNLDNPISRKAFKEELIKDLGINT